MKKPLYVRPLSTTEQHALQKGLRSSDALVMRRSQILIASAHGQHAARWAWHPGAEGPLGTGRVDRCPTDAGAMTQDALQRTAGAVGMAYAQRRATVPETPVVHTDDTGWRVGGQPAHLMVFETDTAIVYLIRPRHRHEAVQEVIPADYAGVMVTDRGRSYDARAFDRVEQQKCLAHILRSLSDVVERGSAGHGSRPCSRMRWRCGTSTETVR